MGLLSMSSSRDPLRRSSWGDHGGQGDDGVDGPDLVSGSRTASAEGVQ
jgi:hypothetical protein